MTTVQTDLFPAGIAAREKGIKRSASANALWLAAAREYAAGLIRSGNRDSVTADDVREWADLHAFHPHTPAAWGGLFRGSPVPGFAWTFAGFRRSRVESNHARRIVRWGLVRVEDVPRGI